jgi:ABC-type uncharacterized transport system auxiliary subunit
MRRATLALCLVALAAAACGSSKVRSRSYYTLAYALTDEERLAPAPRVPVMLRVKELDVELSYDRQPIVYRYSPYQLEFYQYHQWIAKPQRMLTELIYKHLKHANVFRQVTTSLKEGLPDYELEGQVRNIEEFDSDTEWSAHLAMTLQVVDTRTRRLVWRHDFDQRRKVFNHDVIYVVRALSQILEEEMGRVAPSLEAALVRDLAARPAPSRVEDGAGAADVPATGSPER